MSETHKTAARESIQRTIWHETWFGATVSTAMVLFGALMVALGAVCIVYPYLIFEGLGPGNKMGLDTLAFDCSIGLPTIGVGLLLIWWNR
ncbi:MAG TPA: hypothetical protein VMR25_15905 [Planctomycetaceae bacterium]|jgi:hypothetical protein|nr:hypothetical protein [Planctomycetaceae bacterium]